MKSVLHYKKPALWIVIAAVAICVMLAVCFLTNPAKEYQIRVTIPAGSTKPVCYSDEEISPKGNSVTFYAGEGLGDTEISLLPIEVREENAYDEPAYLTPGMPVKMDVEKGAWFKIGVNVQNPTNEDKVVYVSVRGVEVRIAGSVETMVGSLPTEEVASPQAEVIPAKSEPIQDIVLYEQPEAGKVCIEVQPSIIREYLSYYYIPTEKDQEWLSERVKALDLEGKPFAKRWEGHKEIGWQVIYNDLTIRVFEGGYLYYTYDGENGEMECFIEDPELCDYIQNMLIDKIGYRHYDVADIKEIVSAKLEVTSIYTGWKSYSQTITDADTLKKFEEWFCNAKYMYGGTDCGYQSACLELTLASGDVVKLSMATDDCPNFNINGVVYDYRPASDWMNREFYKCFDEIPWEYE